jgi:pimeloyl-ACP methyl ester carboxylesterase
MKILRSILSFTLLASVVSACASGPREPDIALTYNRVAAAETPYRNPVIVVPGVLGSKLKDIRTDQPVWGAFVRGAADPQTDEGLKLITAPYIYPDGSLTNWSHVVPDGALTEVRLQLLGIPLKISAYAQIVEALGAGGFREQQIGEANEGLYDDNHYTAYQFDYDWRLSNADNAAKLYDFVQDVRARVNKVYQDRFGIEDPDVKVDIVAHSMGGLLTRYMLRYGDQGLPEDGSNPVLDWSGTLGVERVVLVGTPNAGSPQALNELIEGKNYGWPFLPFYNQAVLGSFASLYQLMPRDRHNAVRMKDGSEMASIYDFATWEKYGWGLLNPDMEKTHARLFPEIEDPMERRAVVRHTLKTHLLEARRFNKALDIPAAPPERLIFNLVLGDADPTDRVLEYDSEKGKFDTIETAPGDGTVPRYSALMDERADGNDAIWTPRLRSPIDFDGVVILPYDHIGLTQSKVFIDNLLYWLLVEPRASGTPLGYPLKQPSK